jgi:hypothetical protein
LIEAKGGSMAKYILRTLTEMTIGPMQHKPRTHDEWRIGAALSAQDDA